MLPSLHCVYGLHISHLTSFSHLQLWDHIYILLRWCRSWYEIMPLYESCMWLISTVFHNALLFKASFSQTESTWKPTSVWATTFNNYASSPEYSEETLLQPSSQFKPEKTTLKTCLSTILSTLQLFSIHVWAQSVNILIHLHQPKYGSLTFKYILKYGVMNRIRTCEGKSHWISSPTP